MADVIPMKDLKGYLKEDEIKRVINAAANLRDKALLTFLDATAARVNECLSVKVKDIDVGERIVIVRTLKKKKEQYRRIPIKGEKLDVVLGFIKGKKPDDFLFNVSARQVRNIVLKAGKKAGIKVGEKQIKGKVYSSLHPHHFRHSYAIRWVKKSKGDWNALRKLQMILGHASINTTAKYLQFGPLEVREDVDKYG